MSASPERAALRAEQVDRGVVPAIDQVPHLPAPRSAPIIAPLPPPPSFAPIRIAIAPEHLPKLKAYENGVRDKKTMYAVKAVINACAAVASGIAGEARNAVPALVFLPPCLRQTLIYLNGKQGWSDGSYQAIWRQLEPMIFPA